MMKQEQKYQSSFTSGDLLHEEVLTILREAGIEKALNDKLDRSSIKLKTKSDKSEQRTFYEAVRRIKAIPNKDFWKFFLKTNAQNQKLILLYSVLLTYDLILDFMLDVVHEKRLNLQDKITRNDFFEFIESKSRNIPELQKKSQRSIRDMSFSIFKVMRQAGILKRNTLQPVFIDRELKHLFDNMGEGWFIEVLPKN